MLDFSVKSEETTLKQLPEEEDSGDEEPPKSPPPSLVPCGKPPSGSKATHMKHHSRKGVSQSVIKLPNDPFKRIWKEVDDLQSHYVRFEHMVLSLCNLQRDCEFVIDKMSLDIGREVFPNLNRKRAGWM